MPSKLSSAKPSARARSATFRGGIPREDLPGEEWRPTPGWEGIYDVSNLGRVYRCKEQGFPRSGRILRTHVVDGGYFHISLCRNGTVQKVGIHRLVMWAFVGPQPPGLVVRHMDGDPTNNRLCNLQYGTHSQNQHDKVRHGRDHNANKTHCIRGHEFTSENIYVQPSAGNRRCLTCKKERAAKWWAENGEAHNARRRAA